MTAPRRFLQTLLDGAGRPSFITSAARSRSIATYASRFPATIPSNTLRTSLPSSLPASRRFDSTKSRYPNPLTESKPLTPEEKNALEQRRSKEPAYMLTFTCKPCGTRSSHRISHQGYHKGTVLIECPGCKNRHVISDHLKIFMDKGASLEDILAKGGQTLVKGQLSGDLEWWEDGSIRALSDAPLAEPEQTPQSKEETPSGSNEKN